jgi:hypothetical protein
VLSQEEREMAGTLKAADPLPAVTIAQSIVVLIKDKAQKTIKKSETYRCRNGHEFKGKDALVIVEHPDGEEDLIVARLVCPECDVDEILLPNPVLTLDMNI